MNRCLICQESNKLGVQYCDHCGTELSIPNHKASQLLSEVRLEKLEERYQIERLLGSGGFASVYLAQDTRLGRACVVKEMLIPKGATEGERGELQQNFEREVQSLVALNHPGHASIPEIYDYFATRSANYLVMKYIEGQNLEQTLAQMGGRIRWQAAVRIGLAVCDALLYMHAQKPPVLHRDIKPANILIEPSGHIWLVDFGLSKALPTTRGTNKGTTAFGTAGYTSLEQWMERAVAASDIYALGATLHHLITGRDPRQAFESQPDLLQIRQEHGNFPSLRQFEVPETLQELVSAAVQKLPSRRPMASQLKQDLASLLMPSKAAAQPFYFRDGQTATLPTELVPLSLSSWAEARDYLYNGPFEEWFVAQARYDLVKQLKDVIEQEAKQDLGLEQFLRTFSPDLSPPQLKVKHGETNFHYPTTSSPLFTKITLKNEGQSCFDGTFELSQPWLSLNRHELVLGPGQSQDLTLTVQPERVQWGKTYKNQLYIYSNSGQAKLAFSLHTPLFRIVISRVTQLILLSINLFVNGGFMFAFISALFTISFPHILFSLFIIILCYAPSIFILYTFNYYVFNDDPVWLASEKIIQKHKAKHTWKATSEALDSSHASYQ